MSDKRGREGKKFTDDQRVTMALMCAQGCTDLQIAERIGDTRRRVKSWVASHPGRVLDAMQQLDRELKAAEETARRSVKTESFIRPPTMAQLMAGR